ncbi:MAG: NADPH-dependent oxidoreductase [Bacteroidetes bacterium]|nr:MAG: NADPH-dependent oxidoreductase [Bacteroidota bacterium]
MNILILAGSNSSKSINFQLLKYLSAKIEGNQLELIPTNAFELPLYSIDLEEKGFPEAVRALLEKFHQCDCCILSVAEHNSNITAYFKNLLDWLSRMDRHFLLNKKMLLLSCSTGKRGAQSAREAAELMLPRFKGEIIYSMGFPNFQENFQDGQVINPELEQQLQQGLDLLLGNTD